MSLSRNEDTICECKQNIILGFVLQYFSDQLKRYIIFEVGVLSTFFAVLRYLYVLIYVKLWKRLLEVKNKKGFKPTK